MTAKKLIIINIGIALFAILVWWVFTNWEQWGDEKEGNVMMQFVGIMAITLVLGILFVTVVLPNLGDRIGDFFYSAPEKSEPDAYSKAAAKVTQGDYPGAIEAYQAIADEEPDNRFPIVEIAKIQHDNLGDIDAAIHTLENAVDGKEWNIDDAAFIIFRLHDIHLYDKENPVRARQLLEMVVAKFPDTRHSANAHHKLNELNALG